MDSDPTERQLRIGIKLKHARTVKGLRLKDLARLVGCSESMLSKVENDKINPSLRMLHRIARELDITIGHLTYEEEIGSDIVMRKGSRPIIGMTTTREGEGTEVEWLTPQARARLLAASIHFVKPGGGSHGTITHEGEELGYILEGELDLEVDGQTHHLNTGDSFFFTCDRPHGYHNPGEEITKIIWVTTPPTF